WEWWRGFRLKSRASEPTKEEVRLPRQAVFIVNRPFGFANGTTIRIKLQHESRYARQEIGRFRISVTTARDPKRVVEGSASVRSVLGIAPAAATYAQRKKVTR